MNKERPILFSAPMVRALLDGTKTQTRRIVKGRDGADQWHGCLTGDCPHQAQAECNAEILKLCPYGQPGDDLWVRENFRLLAKMDRASPGGTLDSARWFEADGEAPVAFQKFGKLRPSIHMPWWASRISLEIEAIRVERLQDITEEDAIAEGIECTHRDEDRVFWKNYRFKGPHPRRGTPIVEEEHCIVNYNHDPIKSYRSLWESINGPGSWDANPWVWVVTFKRIKP